MIRIKVEGLKETTAYLEALSKGELAFGIAKGVTDLANAARDEVIWDLPNKFTLRTAWWKPGSMYGFNVQRASKTMPMATIYTRAPWMQLQETGGVKRSSAHRLAMPTRGDGGIRRTTRDLVPKNLKPGALGSKAFVMHTKRGFDMLAMRTGRGKTSKLRFLYTLKPQANIPARLHFQETVRKFVNNKGNSYLQRGIEYALRTVRR